MRLGGIHATHLHLHPCIVLAEHSLRDKGQVCEVTWRSLVVREVPRVLRRGKASAPHVEPSPLPSTSIWKMWPCLGLIPEASQPRPATTLSPGHGSRRCQSPSPASPSPPQQGFQQKDASHKKYTRVFLLKSLALPPSGLWFLFALLLWEVTSILVCLNNAARSLQGDAGTPGAGNSQVLIEMGDPPSVSGTEDGPADSACCSCGGYDEVA